MKEKLLRGEWTGVAPLGYSYGYNEGSRKIIAGEKGKLIARVEFCLISNLTIIEPAKLTAFFS